MLHEFRRYVRIPVMTQVSIVGDGRRISASSIEVSTGGMSVLSSEDFSIGAGVEVSFSLMTLPRVNLKGVELVQAQVDRRWFDAADQQRQKIKSWIDSYLEN